MGYTLQQRAARYKQRSLKAHLRWRLILSVSLLLFGLLLNSFVGVYISYDHSYVGEQRLAIRSAVNGLLQSVEDQMAGVAEYVTTSDGTFLKSYDQGLSEYEVSLHVLQLYEKKPEFVLAVHPITAMQDRATDWLVLYTQPQIMDMRDGRVQAAHSKDVVTLENRLFSAFRDAIFTVQMTFDSIFSNVCVSLNVLIISVIGFTLILALCVIFWLWHAFSFFSAVQRETLSHFQQVLTLLGSGDMTVRMHTGIDVDLNEVAIAFNKMVSFICGMQAYVHLQYRAQMLQHACQQEEFNALLQQKQDEMLRLHQDLDKVASIRSQFLSMMSHELRTPLASIIGFGQMIQRSSVKFPLTCKQENNVDRILKNAQHLLSIINDLLDLAQIETGRMDIAISEVDVRQLIMEVSSEIRSLPPNPDITLDFVVDDDILAMRTDSQRLKQILMNLTTNALKFTEQGHVSLHVSRNMACGNLARNREYISISISDTGIGIPLEEQEHVFEAFYQVDNTYSRRYGGMGLGLAIVRELTVLLGGSVECLSLPGEGSTFTVVLPVFLEDQYGQYDECVHTDADRSILDRESTEKDPNGNDSTASLSFSNPFICSEVENSTLIIG